MSRQDTPVLVVGGGSRIARALAPLLGDAAAYVVRRPSGHARETIVDDYRSLPLSVFIDAECVINCVGTPTGDVEHLNRINFEIPCQLAAAARDAGVRHFIHISSFSVYGRADEIGRATPTAPTGDYGRSKLAADEALLALESDRFAVTVLRLPLIYGDDVAGKLAQLLRLWARTRVLPVPTGDVRRAMIGVELSAEVIARIATQPVDASKIVFAADPRPFTYADAARARNGKNALRRFPVPRGFADLVERLAPSVGGRLFADSRLADDDNLAIRYGLGSRLYHDIAAADLS